MVNVYEAVTMYADAQHWITQRVKRCLHRPAELAKAIGLGKSQFYERMRESSWRPEEMQNLMPLLDSAPQLTIGGAEVQ